MPTCRLVEFHKKESDIGPPVETRIAKDELEEFARDNDLEIVENFDLGENLYAYIFKF